MKIKKVNEMFNYSKKLEIFTPIKIKILKNLFDIDKEMSDDDRILYADENIKAGTICDMSLSPSGEIYIEYVGRVYLIVDNTEDFIENEDFIFV